MTDQPTAAIVSQREHWSRQGIVGEIIQAMAAANGKVSAVAAGKAADRILALLANAIDITKERQAEIEAATIERCAGVAANHYPLNSAMRPCGTNIAAAIRNLKGQTS